MTTPQRYLLIAASEHSHTIGYRTQMILRALACVPDHAWKEQAELGERRTFYAPLTEERLIIARVERGGHSSSHLGMITSLEISSTAYDIAVEQSMLLEPLEIMIDYESMTGPAIAEAMKNLIVIDHAELDTIKGFDPRSRHGSALSRITIIAFIVVIVTAAGPTSISTSSTSTPSSGTPS